MVFKAWKIEQHLPGLWTRTNPRKKGLFRGTRVSHGINAYVQEAEFILHLVCDHLKLQQNGKNKILVSIVFDPASFSRPGEKKKKHLPRTHYEDQNKEK